MTTVSSRRLFLGLALAVSALACAPMSYAADEAPDAMMLRLSTSVLDAIKNDKAIQAGDTNKVMALVDEKIIPNINFQRMTASAVGSKWRSATPDQQKRLQEEFRTLLIRTYSGALSQVKDQTVVLKPLRAAPDDTEVIVRSEVRGRSDPIELDYRLEKATLPATGWKIYDLNVLGVWLVETYRGQFAQEINAKGIDGLIASLTARNQSNAKK